MKIIIDKNIPYVHGVLEPWADVEYVEGSKINHDILGSAEAMIIRTRTKCNKTLLGNTGIRFIGTATIGTDHIDLEWCREQGIKCASAPGCNSGSVMQYLASSLVYLTAKYNINPSGTTIGIIGVGNVGSKVARVAEVLGFKVLLNDPPRERLEGKEGFISLDRLLYESDIVSLHVPLTFEGPDKTYQLVDENFLSKMKNKAIFVNTSRGQVVNEKTLLEKLKKSIIKTAVLDVWRNEPDINTELLNTVDIGTAHIAGYSADGKANGGKMIIRQLAEYFDLPLKEWEPETLPEPDYPVIDLMGYDGSDFDILSKAILHTYPIEEDSDKLKKSPEQFEKLRNEYQPRREFHAYKVKTNNELILNKLRALGFR
ncbi:MAG: 4-phosphoerythronate dehydrogenase [Bacteroidales bacterium]|nr:4-phosphoerythronate dehydrogenase [Bacteroidales bacterium]